MELVFEKSECNKVQIQVLVEFENKNGEVTSVTEIFDLEEFEDDSFSEFLVWLLSYGQTDFRRWFAELIYIPFEDPIISSVIVRKLECSEIYEITLSD